MERLLLVGGRGQMGQMFCTFLAPYFAIELLDLDNQAAMPELVARADIVIVSVPLTLTTTVIAELAPYLKPQTLLADFCSIKTEPMDTMLALHSGPVLGLHPMFGPGVNCLQGQTIVVCKGRDHTRTQSLLNALKSEQAKLEFCSAAEHDQMMTVVQAVRHFSTFSLGSFLAREKVDVTRSLQFASPVYRLEIDMVSRLLAQDAELYADIMLATPERRLMISKLAFHYAQLANMIVDNDREGLLQEFNAAKQSFAQEAQRAMQESNVVIAALAQHLSENT
jgi:prephenate dehydrogenase/chorismate mutase/prephenate dehydrogenase